MIRSSYETKQNIQNNFRQKKFAMKSSCPIWTRKSLITLTSRFKTHLPVRKSKSFRKPSQSSNMKQVSANETSGLWLLSQTHMYMYRLAQGKCKEVSLEWLIY